MKDENGNEIVVPEVEGEVKEVVETHATEVVEGVEVAKTPEELAAEEAAKKESELPKEYTKKDLEGLRKSYQRETRKERDARVAAEAREQVLREMLAGKKEPVEQKVVPLEKPTRPKEVDFATTAEYEQALDTYEDARDSWKESTRNKDSERVQQAKAVETAQKTFQETVLAQINEGQKQYKDFDEVVLNNEELVTSNLLVGAIAKKANGHDIQYWLGKNIEECKRLSAISDPFELASEIGEISANLKASLKKASPAAAGTKAPQPASVVAAKTKVLPNDVSLEGKTQADRVKLLEEASRKRRQSGAWRRA